MAFARLEVKTELILNLKGKIDIWIHGYDDDKRELFEIEEVREWLKTVFEKINSWAYFLAIDKNAQFLKLLFICHAKVRRITPGKIYESTNKKISMKLIEYLSEGKYKHG